MTSNLLRFSTSEHVLVVRLERLFLDVLLLADGALVTSVAFHAGAFFASFLSVLA